MIRIVLADDQQLVRTGFRLIVEGEPDMTVVGEAANGEEAVTLVRRERPDVVLMDIQMPVMDGLEATAAISEATDCTVLILTTFEQDDYIFTALRNGASGFLLKNAPPEHLVEAIRTVAGGEALLSPSVTRRIVSEFARRPAPAVPAKGLEFLTDRELEVLRLVSAGKSNGEIADALVVGESTVKTHVSNVLTKLNLRDRVQAVVYAYESGVVQPGGGA